MDEVWKDGLLVLIRAAKAAAQTALDAEERAVARSLVTTVLIAEQEAC